MSTPPTEHTLNYIKKRLWILISVNIPTLLCVFVLLFISCIMTCILYWCIGKIGNFLFGSCIKKNEIIRSGKPTKKRVSIGKSISKSKKNKSRSILPYNSNPFDFSDMTSSRLYALQLGISTFCLFFSISSILYFFEFYIVLLVKYSSTVVFFILAQMSKTSYLSSYLMTFYLLYHDYIRIGDIVLYKVDNHKYKVKAFHLLTTVLRRHTDTKINKDLLLPLSHDFQHNIKDSFLDMPLPNDSLLDPKTIAYNFIQYT